MNTRFLPDLRHWPEYLAEAAGLGLFMISASFFAVVLDHPDSPVQAVLPEAFPRRALAGVVMGLTAIAIIYSRMGRRSGAHLNPAVTLTFFRLGKVAPRDLVGYMTAQFLGGAAGMLVSVVVLGRLLSDRAVRFVVTQPGESGTAVAFLGELAISALLMMVVLMVSNRPRTAGFTGVCAGVCVALFITFEAPLSGMSMNPARTFASAVVAGDFRALWVYFVAPPLGMAAASAIYLLAAGKARVGCAKLQHAGSKRCIFCEYHSRHATPAQAASQGDAVSTTTSVIQPTPSSSS